MFKIKHLAAVSLAAFSFAASAAATTLIQLDAGHPSASFSGSLATNVYDVVIGDLGNLTTILSANSAGGSGYNITGAELDGHAFTAGLDFNSPSLSFDIWTYAAPITVGSHTLKVFGTALSGSYSGSLSLTGTPVSVPTITASVPEPESYAMLLAGLGLMGAIAKRRKAKQA